MSSDNCILGGQGISCWVSGYGIRGSVLGPLDVHHFEMILEGLLLLVR